MQAKNRTSKRKLVRSSSGTGKRSTSRVRNKPKRIGHILSQPGSGHSTHRNNQPAALTEVSMRGITGPQVDLLTMPKGICLLDTEEKMLKAMEDLLPIILDAPRFNDNSRWSNNSRIADVFHYFYLKLHKVLPAEMEDVGIILEKGCYKLRGRLSVYSNGGYNPMPVYFIAEIESHDKALFELCFYMVILLHKNSNIDLWDEDNDNYIFDEIEQALAHYKIHKSDGDYADQIESHELAYKTYNETGDATIFLNRLKKTSASKRYWLKEFDQFKPRTPLEWAIHGWLKLGRSLIIESRSIHSFIEMPPDFNPEDYELEPLTAEQFVKFHWSVSDVWNENFEGMNTAFEREAGSVPFYNIATIGSYSDLAKASDSFPKRVLDFMMAGRLMEAKYRDTFQDPQKLKNALTPKPVRLIDIL